MPHAEDYERARQLVLKHGWNTTCFQIVNPGIEYWFSVPMVIRLLDMRHRAATAIARKQKNRIVEPEVGPDGEE